MGAFFVSSGIVIISLMCTFVIVKWIGFCIDKGYGTLIGLSPIILVIWAVLYFAIRGKQ